jgi:Transposase DDE domain
MNLDDFIITCFCLIDELLPTVTKGKRLRARGPRPKLADSEVVTIEVVGTYLGLSQDQEVFDYFRRHYAHFFPMMAQVDRSTFVRQAANLWAVKERLWCLIRDGLLLYDPSVAIVDSMPIPVCQFARAYRCRRFDDSASFGKDHTSRQTFYGFRLHMRLCWPGVITQMCLAPANTHEGEVVWDLTAETSGLLLGDRNYWLPSLQAALRKVGVILLAPFRKASAQPPHSWSAVLGRVRYRIDTVFGQLTDRCGVKRVWARDLWHLRNRVLRMVLMHTVCVLFNLQEQAPPLQLARVVA